jgi:hypothetical protein
MIFSSSCVFEAFFNINGKNSLVPRIAFIADKYKNLFSSTFASFPSSCHLSLHREVGMETGVSYIFDYGH